MDLIRKKKEDFLDSRSEKASERLVKLREQSSKEERRANIFREERKELDKIHKARTESKDLLNQKRFGGITKFIENADKNIQRSKKVNKKIKKIVGSNEKNPWK